MSSTTTASSTTTPLRRRLGLRHLVGAGLVFIGPAAPVGIYGTLAAKSHGAVVTVYLISVVVMALTALSYAQLSRVVPKAGSVFSYANAAIGPRTGFVAGWMVLLDYLLIPSVAFLFTGLAMHSFLPGVPAWLFTAGAVVVTIVLNLSGVQTLARAAMAVVVAESAVLAVVLAGVVVELAKHGATQSVWSPITGIGGFSLTAVMGAVSVAALAFLGFDGIATFAEENEGSRGLIGRAMIACLLAAGVVFLIQTYLIALITPTSPHQLAADPSLQGTAFYDTVRAQVAPWLATMLGVAKALGATFAGMIGLAAGGRVVMTMSREHRLPKVLSVVSSRAGVPVVATVSVTAIAAVLSVWAAYEPTGLDLLSSTVSLGALSAFILLHASVVGYHVVRRGSRNYLVHLAVPVVGIATLIAIVLTADHNAQTVAAVWFVIGLVVAIAQRGRTSAATAASAEGEIDG